MTKSVKLVYIVAWVTLIILFIILIGCYNSGIYAKGYEQHLATNIIEVINSVEIMVVFIIAVIHIKDFGQAALRQGEYAHKKMTLGDQVAKVVVHYVGFIMLGSIVVLHYDISYGMHDKLNEARYYLNEYKNIDKVINKYENSSFLEGRKYTLWENDTMYKDGEFTAEFNEIVRDKIVADESISTIIYVNKKNIIPVVIEDIYYVVQTVTTLGYGNITPSNLMGMVIASSMTLIGQYITIFGVILIIRDERKDETR